MPDKRKRVLLTLLEVALCLAALYCLFWAWFGFRYGAELPRLEPYLAPERLKERQEIWRFFGSAAGIGALLSVGLETALRLHRRKKRNLE